MTDSSTQPTPLSTPSVLVVLVVKDSIGWLRTSLSALGAQTYPRMGVVAVDNASHDGSTELLVKALGERRVVTLEEDRELAGAVARALEHPAARAADYLLVLHDDTALDPDAVARLVEAAVGIGVDDVGIVGPKLVDWDEPRLLLDVGRSADRFGHPYTPLQPGEIDQGQFDRVVEVLCVPTSAMLVARDVWQRIGSFDERLDARHEDLDLCWRARLAGFRVVMTPLARARHREASARGERRPDRHHRSDRFYEDRAAIAAMLKNYALVSLLWLLPLDLILAFVRLTYLLLTRRFDGALDLVAAWGWNVVHLPGTLSRRVRAQSVRKVRDRQLRRFMESAGLRLPRWFETAGQILVEQREIEQEDEGVSVRKRLRDRTASLVGTHPVVVASFLAVGVAAVAFRGLWGPEQLAGGALPGFPASWQGFFTELVSGYRTTPLGGTLAASPSLGAMGALSWLTFGSGAIAQKVLLAGGPILASVMMYRALARLTGRPGAAVLGAASYAFSAIVLWSFSEGRIDLLVALCVLPALAERLESAFSRGPSSDGWWRFTVGMGVTLALGVAFLPGLALAAGVMILVQALFGASRGRGLMLVLSAIAIAVALLFPFVPTIASGGATGLGSQLGTTAPGSLAHLVLGGGPGTWVIAAFLPIAAILAFALVGPDRRGVAIRAMTTAIAGLALAWLSSAGYLPEWAANVPVYLAMTAMAEAIVVGVGLSSVLAGLGREAFGLRQIGAALLALVLGGGLVLQAAAAMVGSWSIGGPEALPPAWALVTSGTSQPFRVLWVGADTGMRFVAPGGDPVGVAPDGASSVRYGLTDRTGISALDIGRSLTGGGAAYLRTAIDQILSGDTVHGGALLAPLGVRFLISERGDLPAGAQDLIDAQVDLDRLGTSGLLIYRNAAALPPAAVIPGSEAMSALVGSDDPDTIARLPDVRTVRLQAVEGGWAGVAPAGGIALVSTGYSGDWRLDLADGTMTRPREAFGWSTSFDVPSGTVRIHLADQWVRTAETIALGLLWVAALWITRKPVSR